MAAAKLRLAMAAMGKPGTAGGLFWNELGVTRQTQYQHIGQDGSLWDAGRKLL